MNGENIAPRRMEPLANTGGRGYLPPKSAANPARIVRRTRNSNEYIDPLMPCYMTTASTGRRRKQTKIITVRPSLDAWHDAASPLSLAVSSNAHGVARRQDGTFPHQPG